jgi:N-acetylated-alpha-linked acidic dipeptidase
MANGSDWLDARSDRLRDINRDIYRSERDLLHEGGLPEREWFRHVMYATGINTGFAPEPMPGLQQTIKWDDASAAQEQADIIEAAIHRLANRVDRIVGSLSGL